MKILKSTDGCGYKEWVYGLEIKEGKFLIIGENGRELNHIGEIEDWSAFEVSRAQVVDLPHVVSEIDPIYQNLLIFL